MKNSLVIKVIALAFALLTLSACSSINSSIGGFFNMDTDLEIKFKVDADVNPDDDRKPSPLFVRMYQLKSTKMFTKANFIDLYEKDKDVLGADMLSKQVLRRIKPGESRDENFVLNKKTRYIGLYAEFLQYKKSSFKLIIPVVPTNVIGTTEEVLISGNRLIHLSSDKPAMTNASANYKEESEKAAKLKSLYK